MSFATDEAARASQKCILNFSNNLPILITLVPFSLILKRFSIVYGHFFRKKVHQKEFALFRTGERLLRNATIHMYICNGLIINKNKFGVSIKKTTNT